MSNSGAISFKNQVLGRIPLFAGLTPVELEKVAQRALERRFAPGELLAREGDLCQGFYILSRGKVKIFKTSRSGREITLTVESAPSSVAEIPMFDGGPYPASVSAITEVSAYLISTQDFRKCCLETPQVALKVLAVVGGRLRRLVAVVESVSFGSIRQRLAQILVELYREQGRNPVYMPLTHQELASRLGTVREVVSRNLSRFQSEGLLKIHRREIGLIDIPGLEREAETEF